MISFFYPTVRIPILENPVGVSAFSPSAVKIRCSATCIPACSISWIVTFPNGSGITLISSTSGNFNITEQVNGDTQTSILTLEPTSELDTGNYSCRAMNLAYENTSRPAEVIISHKGEQCPTSSL